MGRVERLSASVQIRRHRVEYRDLHTCNEAETQTSRHVRCLGDSVDAVMVCERQELDPGFTGSGYRVRRRQLTIGMDRVGLELESRRGTF